MKKCLVFLLSLLLVISLIPTGSLAASEEEKNIELWNAVKPLETTVTFLNTGAHPDDERSDLLAYLSRGLGVQTASLIANRGEGGQNEIGYELGDALGIIRSREMVEAAKVNGVPAYHLSETTSDPIYDFGFSKSVEETLENWGEDVAYERFIRLIRTHKPDIVMPSFRDVDSQHGHHRAITVLSLRAFQDAADPAIFPEHLEEGLHVWQIKKLYLPAESEQTATVSIEIGDYDPIYKMTYPQLGEVSRFMHKSQGMGREIPAEPRQFHLELVESAGGELSADSLFAGIPYDFSEWAKIIPQKERNIRAELNKLQTDLASIVSAYPNHITIFRESASVLKDVQKISKDVEKSSLAESVKNDLLHKLSVKQEQLEKVSFVSSQLEVEASIQSNILTQGEKSTVQLVVTNNGTEQVNHVQANLLAPGNWVVQSPPRTGPALLKPGESKTYSFSVTVADDAEYYHAYHDPVLQASISYQSQGVLIEQPIEIEGTIAVLPEISLSLNPEDIAINTSDRKDNLPVKVKVRNYHAGAVQATVALEVPDGWRVYPESREVSLDKRFAEKEISFTLIPSPNITDGQFFIGAKAESSGKVFDSTIQEIYYEHIGNFYYQYPAQIRAVAFELLKPDNFKVGYIDSGFDQVAEYLENAGFAITKLGEEDLSSGDLNQYDTIVLGIRAYLSRDDLLENNHRLLKYVEEGGHLVVSYHKPEDRWDSDLTAPYKLVIGNPSIRWRVTDEDAKVEILQPDHAFFTYPNQITEEDWNNWVQERGLYFPMEWDNRYETFVSMADPNEEPFTGGILMASYGKGTYVYTNLVFYRQMQSQVPGGYRIFANLISYGKYKNMDLEQ